jgi:WD40 repeat protein
MSAMSLPILSLMEELQRMMMTQVPDLIVLDAYARETESARSVNFGEALSVTPPLIPVGAMSSQSASTNDGFDMLNIFRVASEATSPGSSSIGGGGGPSESSEKEMELSASASFGEKALKRRSTITNHKVLDELETAEEDETASIETFSFGDFVMGSTTIDESPVARVKPKSENAFMFGDFFVDDVPMEQFRPNRKPGNNPDPSSPLSPRKQKYVSRHKISVGTGVSDFQFHHLRSHTGRIRGCVIASQRDNCIISCSEKESYPRLMAEDGLHPLQLYLGHQTDVLHVSVSADCSLIGTSGLDGLLLIFEVSTGIKSGDARHPCSVRCSSFSKNAKFIVSGAEDGNCRLWASKKKGQITAMSSYFRQKGSSTCISFQPTGDLIASGSSDTSVHVWSGSTAKLCFTVQEKHLGPILSVSFNGAGDRLLSADQGRAVISDCTSGLPIFVMDSDAMRLGRTGIGSPRFSFSAVSFGPSSIPNIIFFCGSDKRVVVHELVASSEEKRSSTPKTPTGQKLRVPMIALSPEVWSFQARSPVVCLNASTNRAVALGDAAGNVTLLVMAPRPQEKQPPLALYKQAKQLAAKRKEKAKPPA